MRRVLVVGCGGSGGATLAYMMDQLRADLAAVGVEELPEVWQFVHIDVPVSEDKGPVGMDNVAGQGGHYVGIGAANSYQVVDAALYDRLRSGRCLADFGTWAPRDPEEVTVSVSEGAGQYRAIGRVLTLNDAARVGQILVRARDRMYTARASTRAVELGGSAGGAPLVPGLGRFQAASPPLVLLVSSMAGGSGASMALDVSRILTSVQSVEAANIALFLYSAEVFEKTLSPAERSGVSGNTLALLGEIVAAQASDGGQADEVDTRIIRAAGVRLQKGKPFARVFPIGRRVGGDGAEFGDGSAAGVYRGLGRGLAALVKSESALNPFVAFDLGNPGSPPGDQSYLGWGANWDSLPWGGFGFASLSMGRDRYAEYAAQRISRAAVDRLVEGHMQPGDQATSLQQRDRLVASQFETVCARLALPPDAGRAAAGQGGQALDPAVRSWLISTAMTQEFGQAVIGELLEWATGSLHPADGMEPALWAQGVAGQLQRQAPALMGELRRIAYRWAFEWRRGLVERTEQVFAQALASFGLSYAVGLVDRFTGEGMGGGYCDVVARGLEAVAMAPVESVAVLPARVQQEAASFRGKVAGGDYFRDLLRRELYRVIGNCLTAEAARMCCEVVRSWGTDVLTPVKEAMTESLTVLEHAQAEEPRHDGVARVATDDYPSWPTETDERVPERFSQAHNEVLVTDVSAFADQFVADLPSSLPGDVRLSYRDALVEVGTQVVAGQWRTTGGRQAPGNLVERQAEWMPEVFKQDPDNPARSLVRARAAYVVHAKPAEVLARARQYIARPGESFAEFCDQSLRGYLRDRGVGEVERQTRAQDVQRKFEEARALALPLVAVNRNLVSTIHKVPVHYNYKFSAIPFDGEVIADVLRATLEADPSVEPITTVQRLGDALTREDGARRVDIFGSYRNYSPLVFASVVEPVDAEWHSLPETSREAFWKWRRARPLSAVLPMADAERLAMAAGWYLGQLVGCLEVPGRNVVDRPARVWDRRHGTWLSFPFPMLTAPDAFLSSNDEWFAAVMESHLLAVVGASADGLGTLRPYQALRELYDEGVTRPTGATVDRAALVLLADWIATGHTASGRPPRVREAAEATTPEGRAQAAGDWLAKVRRLFDTKYLAPGVDGATGGGAFSVISDREHASALPLTADLAVDCHRAAGLLADMVPLALAYRARAVDEFEDTI